MLTCIRIVSLAVALLASSAAAQEPAAPITPTDQDLVFGTWTLNLEASTYEPGPAPKSQTRTYEADLDGVKTTITTVDASGKSRTAHYVADYDSLEYPVTGSPRVSAISLKRISARQSEVRLRHARKEIGVATRVIAKDGKTLTITYRGTDPEGRPVRVIAVYDRAEPSR